MLLNRVIHSIIENRIVKNRNWIETLIANLYIYIFIVQMKLHIICFPTQRRNFSSPVFAILSGAKSKDQIVCRKWIIYRWLTTDERSRMLMPEYQLLDEKQEAANRLKCLISRQDLTARDVRHCTCMKSFANGLCFEISKIVTDV